MKSLIVLVITCFIYQAQAGGSVNPPTTTAVPESTAKPSCVLCVDVLSDFNCHL